MLAAVVRHIGALSDPHARHVLRQPGACRPGGGMVPRRGDARRRNGGRQPARRTDHRGADFFQGAMETALAPDELLAEARLPLLPAGARFGFAEFSRRAGDYAQAMALVVLRHRGRRHRRAAHRGRRRRGGAAPHRRRRGGAGGASTERRRCSGRRRQPLPRRSIRLIDPQIDAAIPARIGRRDGVSRAAAGRAHDRAGRHHADRERPAPMRCGWSRGAHCSTRSARIAA